MARQECTGGFYSLIGPDGYRQLPRDLTDSRDTVSSAASTSSRDMPNPLHTKPFTVTDSRPATYVLGSCAGVKVSDLLSAQARTASNRDPSGTSARTTPSQNCLRSSTELRSDEHPMETRQAKNSGARRIPLLAYPLTRANASTWPIEPRVRCVGSRPIGHCRRPAPYRAARAPASSSVPAGAARSPLRRAAV